jgi:NADH-quinone oxidoreductase subunit N
MNAPFLWIVLPLALAAFLMFLKESRFLDISVCLFVFFLALTAWLLPIDAPLSVAGWSFKLASSLQILGRQLSLTSADRSFLVLIYGSAVFWFLPVAFIRMTGRLVPLGLAITALLVATLAVQPFLYAGLLIEVAGRRSLPRRVQDGGKPGKGLIRFLIFQTLAVPCILFSGWLLAGIEANPGNLGLVQQAAVLLGLGFAFLLAVFPFYTWIPLLTEEGNPYYVGFILWMIPTATMFFGLGFIDRYTWLRDAPLLGVVLTTVGTLMVVSGGLLAAFQRHLGRILGYAVIVETGLSLLAVSLAAQSGLTTFFLLFVPRSLSLGVWSLALFVLRQRTSGLSLVQTKAAERILPFATAGLILANLALAGMPLLLGFPAHQMVWEGLAHNSLRLSFWVFCGSLGLVVGAIRSLYTFAAAPEGVGWESQESRPIKIFLGSGIVLLFLLGSFPQWLLPLWTALPAIFTHFGQ